MHFNGFTLSPGETARQIANMLNTHNKLRVVHDARSILRDPATYFVRIVRGDVVGCLAIKKVSPEFTKSFHLCVLPEFRKGGIARELKLASMKHVTTPFIFVTIREDNVPSLRLNMSIGFTPVKKTWSKDHFVLTLTRRSQLWR